MSENSMWGRVRTAMKGLDPVRVENKCEAGTPDVNYVQGWVELKQVKRRPKKDKILRIKHYTKQQETWAVRRHAAGGRVFLLLKVANEWLIFKGQDAPNLINKVSLEVLREKAIKVWLIKLNDAELRAILTSS